MYLHLKLLYLAGFSLFCSAILQLKGQAILEVADQSLSEDATTVTVPITVTGFSGIGGMQFTLAWDPAVLTFNTLGDFDHSALATELFYFTETNFNVDNVSDGYFTVLYEQILAADATVADGETIFSVTFDVVGASGASSQVSFTDDPTLRLSLIHI